jgi:DNA mismatch repair ATPase MutL
MTSSSSLAALLHATVEARRTGLALSASTTAASATANETHSRAQALPALTRRPTVAMIHSVERATQWGGRRFLVGISAGAVIVADQHGVSERIRLDRFVPQLQRSPHDDPRHNHNHNNNVTVVCHALVPAQLPIPEPLVVEVLRFRSALAKWHFHVAGGGGDDDDDDDSAALALTSVPAIVVEGAARVPRQPIAALGEAITVMRETCDEAAAPPCLHRLLVDRSCRGAIMFGDTLTDATAARLFQSATSATQFDLCSHGRPTLAHVATVPFYGSALPAANNPYAWNPQ